MANATKNGLDSPGFQCLNPIYRHVVASKIGGGIGNDWSLCFEIAAHTFTHAQSFFYRVLPKLAALPLLRNFQVTIQKVNQSPNRQLRKFLFVVKSQKKNNLIKSRICLR